MFFVVAKAEPSMLQINNLPMYRGETALRFRRDWVMGDAVSPPVRYFLEQT